MEQSIVQRTLSICQAEIDDGRDNSILGESDYDVIIFHLNRKNESKGREYEFQNSRGVKANQEIYQFNSNGIGDFVMADHELSSKVNLSLFGVVESYERHTIGLSFLSLQSNPSVATTPAIDLKGAKEDDVPSCLDIESSVDSMEVSGHHLIVMYGCSIKDQDLLMNVLKTKDLSRFQD